jgi:hypothetical protein
MKRYLLFAYDDFQGPEHYQHIIEKVSKLTHTELVRFKISDTSIFLHFGSNYEFTELVNTLKLALHNVVSTHFLVEYTDKVSISMNEIDLEYFTTLNLMESESKAMHQFNDDISKLENGSSILDLLREITFSDYEDCDDDTDDYCKPAPRSNKQNFNLDDILDKVGKQGRMSLTKEEEQFLKTI